MARGLCVTFYYHLPKIIVKQPEPTLFTKSISEWIRESIMAILLQHSKPLALREIAKLFSESSEQAAQLSDRAIRAQLYQLQDQHMIKAIGHGRGAKWILNDKA